MQYHQLIEQSTKWILQEFDRSDFVESSLLKPHQKNETSTLLQPALDLSLVKQVESSEIVLITSNESEQELSLLKRLSQAIDQRIAKATLVAISKTCSSDWLKALFSKAKKTRWVLISELELYQVGGLITLYKKKPHRSLCEIPVFLLADLKAYHENPELKKSLWTTLLNQL